MNSPTAVLLGRVGGLVCTVVGGRLVGGSVVAGAAVGGIVDGGTGGSKGKRVRMLVNSSLSI